MRGAWLIPGGGLYALFRAVGVIKMEFLYKRLPGYFVAEKKWVVFCGVF